MWLNSTLVFSGVFGVFSMGGKEVGGVPGDISGSCFSLGFPGWTLESVGEAVHRSKC